MTMKFGMKVQKDIANDLPLSFSGLRTRAARKVAHRVRTASFGSTVRRAMKFGMKVQTDIAHNLPLLFSGSRAHRAQLRTECAQ